MRKLSLFLLALSLYAVPPNVTITGVDGVSHSVARLKLNTDIAYDSWRVRYVLSPASCSGGTGGTIIGQPDDGGGIRTSGMTMLVTGLAGGSVYKVCPEVHNTDGWSTGAETTVTTSAMPAVHPALPIPPDSFDPYYPDTTGYATYTTASDCNDLQAAINTALGVQKTTGTIIYIPAGAVCDAIPQVRFPVYAADIVYWHSSDVTAGSPGVISFPTATFTEGQMVTFGRHYADGSFADPPTSSSCSFGNGMVDGGKFFLHIVSDNGTTQTVNVKCGDGSGNTMDFSDTGLSTVALEFAPFVQKSGNCPSESGPTACTFQSRNMKWIVIRSNTADNLLPPPGVRMDRSFCDAGLCAQFVVPLANVDAGASPQWYWTAGSNDGQEEFMTANIHIGPGIETTNAFDASERPFCTMWGLAEWASDYVFDRVWFHGNETHHQRWSHVGCDGAYWNGTNVGFIDSSVTNLRDWHATNLIDGSSIVASRGPGPYIWANNLLEGAGVPLHFDDDAGSTSHVRSGYNIFRNTFLTPFKWMVGSSVSDGDFSGHRQPLEWKGGSEIAIKGNIFNGNWSENTQASVFIAFTSVNGIGINGNIDISDNTFEHGPGGINAVVVGGNDPVTISPRNFRAENNLFYDIRGGSTGYSVPGSGVAVGRGWSFQGPNGGEDYIFDHNTFIGNTGAFPAWFWLFNYPVEGVQVTNNFIYTDGNTQGIEQEAGTGSTSCDGLKAKAMMDCFFTPAYQFSHNVIMSGDSDQTTVTGWYSGLTNYVPASMNLANVGWRNYDSTGAGGSYGLSASSAYISGASSRALNGTDVGINEVRLLRSQGHVVITDQPVQPIGTTTATVNFGAPDSHACPVRVALTAWTPTAPTSGVTEFADSGTKVGPRNVALTGLTTGTHYYGKVFCAVEQPEFQFTTH